MTEPKGPSPRSRKAPAPSANGEDPVVAPKPGSAKPTPAAPKSAKPQAAVLKPATSKSTKPAAPKPAAPPQPEAPASAFAGSESVASERPEPEAAAPTPTPREAAVEALMRLAAEQPWSDIEVGDVAREAGLSLAELRDLFPSKGAILGGLARIIDRKVLEQDGSDLAEEPTRERLFDVLMRRLDAMTPYKPALRRISYALRGDPFSVLALNGVMLNSHRYMLAAAGIDTEGPLGQLKLQGVVIAFARVTQVWLEDEDPALARTMARLDKEIRNGERFMERAEDVRRLTAPLRAIGRSLLDRRSRRDRDEELRDDPPMA